LVKIEPVQLQTQLVNRAIHRKNYAQLPRLPLQVCAALVQNPANLGGLCRTVEAFRLEALVLADLGIAQHPQFKNLAASAHHWQPLMACPVDALSSWLQNQQQAGYAVIALDADAAAIPLPRFCFPLHSVLVLGQELTGLPADLLTCCDHRVTIPQAGLVESFNVQTAAAIAVYEYIRQHSWMR
jgi:tRNA guanosine-2'-O-methyltransferase